MKVLLAFCALFAATQAGLITYPLHTTYLQAPVLHTNKLGAGFAYTTIGHPFLRSHVGLTYTGYPLAYPSYYSPNIIPGAFFAPPVLQLVPALPSDPKKDEKATEAPAEGTTEESKPADAENIDSEENKEDEEPKPSEESAQSDDSVSIDSA